LFALAGEDQHYHSGDRRSTVEVEGWRILPLICYDLRFPVWSRSRIFARRVHEYDILVYVANWPFPRIEAWTALLKARGIENQAYCLGVNRVGEDEKGHQYNGYSAAYDYEGKTLLQSTVAGVLQMDLQAEALRKFREKLPFQQDGDVFHFD
jgi:predicted amidohydrolase